MRMLAALYIAQFALGIGVLAYPQYAHMRGWVVGSWTHSFGWVKTFAILNFVSALTLSAYYIGLLGVAGVLFGGFLLAFVLVTVLRGWFQALIPLSFAFAIGTPAISTYVRG